MNQDIERLYQEMILEHNKKPRNFKELEKHTHYSHGKNPLCGDDYVIFVDLDQDNIKDIGFKGSGCAISKASGSMLTSMVKGKSKDEALTLKDQFIQMVTKNECPPDCQKCLGNLRVFEGVKKFPVRVKCATLIWRALENALEKEAAGDTPVSTET